MASSSPEELTSGTFRPVIDDPRAVDHRELVTRLVLCSGRVTVDLESSPQREKTAAVAIARVEQLAPFQRTAIGKVIAEYPNLQEIVWLQEEPKNMGAWSFIGPRIQELVGNDIPVRYIGRPERSSPAVGSLDRHNQEQAAIVAAAFADAPEVKPDVKTAEPVSGANGHGSGRGNGSTGKRATKQPAAASSEE